MGNLIRASVGDPIVLQQLIVYVFAQIDRLTPGKVKTLPDFEQISREAPSSGIS